MSDEFHCIFGSDSNTFVVCLAMRISLFTSTLPLELEPRCVLNTTYSLAHVLGPHVYLQLTVVSI